MCIPVRELWRGWLLGHPHRHSTHEQAVEVRETWHVCLLTVDKHMAHSYLPMLNSVR